MCFECRIKEELEKHIKGPMHLANMHTSAVYRNIVDGVKSEKSVDKLSS